MMTVDTFRQLNQQASVLLRQRNLREAGKLFQSLYSVLEMNTYRRRLSKQRFDKVFFGLIPDDVLYLLFNKAVYHLNACETKEALDTIKCYQMIERDFSIHGAPDVRMSQNEIEAYRRLGNNEKAILCCEKLLKTNLESRQRAEVLITKGSIESSDSHWVFGINTLSIALAEAEADGTPSLIARCYLELDTMIGTQYPALGLSFLWKARVHYERAKESESVAFCKSRMAMAYFLLWHRYQQSGERFIVEARRLVNEELTRNDFSHEGAKYSFDRLKGLLNNDLKLIEASMDFFENIKAYGDFYRSADFYIKTALSLGDRKAAKTGAKRYEQKAASFHDEMRLNYIRNIDLDKAVACWVPEQEPKKLPNLLDVLEGIAFSEEWFHLEKNVFRCLFPTHYQEGMFETVEMADGSTHLYPCTLFPYKYFRGQTDKFEGKKCKPSLFRGLSEAQMFHERLCLKELEVLLSTYPLTRVFEGEMGYETPDGVNPIFLNVDVKALGQHYGIKTDVLDLTADKWVAAFFASTECKDGKYQVWKKGGEGVIYIYQDRLSIIGAMNRLIAVGLQPFSRPGCQAGLVYKMFPDEDFNVKAQRVVFQHDPEIAEFVYNYCNRSKKLFPDEILEEKVKAIKAARTCSQLALSNVVKEYYQEKSEAEILGWLNELEISITEDSPVKFTDEELKDCEERWNKEKEHFFDNVNVRVTYSGPIKFSE